MAPKSLFLNACYAVTDRSRQISEAQPTIIEVKESEALRFTAALPRSWKTGLAWLASESHLRADDRPRSHHSPPYWTRITTQINDHFDDSWFALHYCRLRSVTAVTSVQEQDLGAISSRSQVECVTSNEKQPKQ